MIDVKKKHVHNRFPEVCSSSAVIFRPSDLGKAAAIINRKA